MHPAPQRQIRAIRGGGSRQLPPTQTIPLLYSPPSKVHTSVLTRRPRPEPRTASGPSAGSRITAATADENTYCVLGLLVPSSLFDPPAILEGHTRLGSRGQRPRSSNPGCETLSLMLPVAKSCLPSRGSCDDVINSMDMSLSKL